MLRMHTAWLHHALCALVPTVERPARLAASHATHTLHATDTRLARSTHLARDTSSSHVAHTSHATHSSHDTSLARDTHSSTSHWVASRLALQ
eukprot:359993-Chlamydomonas_euryale.AAC.4